MSAPAIEGIIYKQVEEKGAVSDCTWFYKGPGVREEAEMDSANS